MKKKDIKQFTGMPQRENIYEYPFEAISEAVINSVMHKDYFEHGHNNILRFLPNEIRIENYWTKPSNFILGKTVFRRNQIIADLFARIHFDEKMGTGFERIKEICKKEKAPVPKIEFNEHYFYVTFKQSTKYLKFVEKETLEKFPEKFPEKTEEKTLYLIKKDKNITIKELAKLTNISERAIKKQLFKLKSEKKLERVGPDKGGYWKVIKK